jgi:glutamyl-tRNA reductase
VRRRGDSAKIRAAIIAAPSQSPPFVRLFALGLNHRTAPLAIREKVAFQADALASALVELKSGHAANEAAIVSTCNRTELYCTDSDPELALDWLVRRHELKRPEIEPYVYTLNEQSAVLHAFRVASGLDSMVLGEPQILGQLKQAVASAQHAGTLGTLLSKLFQHSFSVAKDVRATTAIGANIVSMAAAAVHLAERLFGSLAGKSVLFIGAGEMIESCAAHFAAQRPRQIAVANRSMERAAALALRFRGQAIRLDELGARLGQFDVVVSCTGSSLPIVGKGMVESAVRARRHAPMFMLDLAVPRDIEAEVHQLDDVFLYTVDDLASIVSSGLEARQGAVVHAERIIETKVIDFMRWLEARARVPAIRALRDQAERTRRHAIQRAMKRLARGEPAPAVLEALSHALTNKLLHAPTRALGDTVEPDRAALAEAVARMYQLPKQR